MGKMLESIVGAGFGTAAVYLLGAVNPLVYLAAGVLGANYDWKNQGSGDKKDH